MEKKRGWLATCVVCLLPLVLVLLVPYALVSAPFTPPSNDAPPPVLRKFPLAERPTPLPAPVPPGVVESPSSEITSPSEDSPWVAALVSDFQSRHSEELGDAERFVFGSIRKDFFHIAYLVLKRQESHETMLKLITDPDVSVRIAAMKALIGTYTPLMAEHQSANSALLDLWRKLDERQIDAVVAAATETLLYETERGDVGNMPLLLTTLGDYALPAVPHLIWVSDHHPYADMRTYASNAAMAMDPTSAEVNDLMQRLLVDPDPWVRLNALQGVALHSAAAIAGIEETGPPTATSESALKST